MVRLRPYQVDAVSAATRLLNAGGDPLIVHATGSGKTVTLSRLVQNDVKNGGNVLILAHRQELLNQIQGALTRINITSIRDIQEWGSCNVVVTSPATARKHLRTTPAEVFSLVVVDEAHHAVAGGHRKVIEYFRAGGARVCGFTATPDRLDRIGLSNVFSDVAHEFNIRDAVDAGYLVRARAMRIIVDGMDLSEVRTVTRNTTAGGRFTDLHPGDLGRVVMQDTAVSGVVEPLLELATKRTVNNEVRRLRTVVFAVNIPHMMALCDAINARGGKARWVSGAMGKKARAATLASFAAGEFQFLVNVMILTEGWDCPSVECVAMVRPTQSRILFAQACGRGLRLHEGKDECLILDFTSASSRFVLVGPEDALRGGLSGDVEYHNAPATKVTPTTKVVVTGVRKHKWWAKVIHFLFGRW